MPATKRYAGASYYETKLEKVMEKFGVEEFNFNWDRHSAWVEFRLEGELYRFDHSINKAKEAGENLVYGSDAFAQIVLALEDLARIVNRGIYQLKTWVAGMRYLPPPIEIPSFFATLGFTTIPTSTADVKQRYRDLAKQMHPDQKGQNDDFLLLKTASEQALKYMETVGK